MKKEVLDKLKQEKKGKPLKSRGAPKKADGAIPVVHRVVETLRDA